MLHRHTKHISALLLVGALALAGCSSHGKKGGTTDPEANPSGVNTSPSPSIRSGQREASNAGAEWLANHFTDGAFLQSEVGTGTVTDVGLTIDALFAMAATEQFEQAEAIATWLSDQTVIDGYAGDTPGMIYPGAIAKTGLALSLKHVKYPGSTDAQRQVLQDRLIARLDTDGRFTVDSEYSDTSSPISQSLAIVFLIAQEALDGLEADPVAFLVGSACEDGSFPDMFGAPGPCNGSVDSTAYAIQALTLLPDQAEALAKATEWLVGAQNEHGQWDGWDGPSVNSTALVVLNLHDIRTGPNNLAVGDGWTALASRQLDNGAWPASFVSSEPDVRATVAAIQATAQVSLLGLTGLKAG